MACVQDEVIHSVQDGVRVQVFRMESVWCVQDGASVHCVHYGACLVQFVHVGLLPQIKTPNWPLDEYLQEQQLWRRARIVQDSRHSDNLPHMCNHIKLSCPPSCCQSKNAPSLIFHQMT